MPRPCASARVTRWLRLDDHRGHCEAPPWHLGASCRLVSTVDRGQPKLSASIFLAALAQLGRLDEAHCAVKAGLALDPAFTVSRDRAARTAMSDHPTFLAGLEPVVEGMRKAGVPEQ